MEIEIGIGKAGRRAYGFDDIAIVPSRRTRDPEDVDLSWEIDAYQFQLPLMASAMDSVAMFAKHNGCAAKPVRRDIAKGMVHVDTWAGGEAGTEVVLYSIEKGNHGWPTGRRGSVAATPLIWEFFAAHPRGGAKNEKRKSKRSKKPTVPKQEKQSQGAGSRVRR